YQLLLERKLLDSFLEGILLWIIFNFPAFLSGYYFSKDKNTLQFLEKNLEIIMIFFSISLFKSVLVTAVKGESFISFGGGTYQNVSYIAALSMGMNFIY